VGCFDALKIRWTGDVTAGLKGRLQQLVGKETDSAGKNKLFLSGKVLFASNR
jgi:hypothetical protein